MEAKQIKALRFGGFSVLELTTAVVALVLVTLLACSIISDRPQIQDRDKLLSDTRVLNAAVEVHRIFGGSLAGVASVEEALLVLKSSARRGTGSLVDVRLRPEMQSDGEALGTGPRVVWNTAQEQFEIAYSGDAGARKFWLDESLASMDFASHVSRERGDRFAARSGKGALATIGRPGLETSREMEPGDNVSGKISASKVLEAPVFSIPAGAYAIIDFDLNVRIENPNPGQVSRVLYSLDEGPWTTYEGEVLVVQPGTKLLAYADSTDPDWGSSEKTGDAYIARAVKLNSPVITASAPQFDFATRQVVQVRMDDPNQDGISKLEYRLEGGPWQSYRAPFDLGVFNFRQHGAAIEARAVPTEDHFSRSEVAKIQVQKPGAAAVRSSRGKNFLDNAMGLSQASPHRVARAVIAPLSQTTAN